MTTPLDPKRDELREVARLLAAVTMLGLLGSLVLAFVGKPIPDVVGYVTAGAAGGLGAIYVRPRASTQ